MGSTDTFIVEDLEHLRRWLVSAGFREEPASGEWEIGRFRKSDPSGTLPPVLIYRNKHGRITCYPNSNTIDPTLTGEEPPHRFAAKSPPYSNEAEAARTAPASADDLPW